jgi:DNA-directed RNA polymerase subunit RPC12/RpoP
MEPNDSAAGKMGGFGGGMMWGLSIFRTKCAKCGTVQVHQNKPLETVRMNVCPQCKVRTVVIGHEHDDDASKRTSANWERGGLRDGDNERAMRILESAFREKG